MSDLQLRFIEEYCVDCNGSAAAIRAGYSEKTAAQEAYKLRNQPEIKAAIEERLKSLSMSAEEAIKRVSDIARTRLNDYLTVRPQLTTPIVRKGLQHLIDELKEEIEMEEEYASRAHLEEDEFNDHHKDQQIRKKKILRFEIELERNPNAYRDVPGESEWREQVTVDMVALAKAKEDGMIQELSFTEHGPKVKMYSSAKELETILKLNGKLVTRHDLTTDGKPLQSTTVDLTGISAEERAALVLLARKSKPD